MIDCKPLNEASPYKPKKLLQLETESLQLRTEKLEGHFMTGTNGKVNQIIQ